MIEDTKMEASIVLMDTLQIVLHQWQIRTATTTSHIEYITAVLQQRTAYLTYGR